MSMASITVEGTARVSFSTEIEVDIDDQVDRYLSDTLGSDFNVEDIEIDSVST